MGALTMDTDMQLKLCQFVYEGRFETTIESGPTIPDADPERNEIASIRTPKSLSMLAFVSKTFRQQLWQHRVDTFQASVRQFIQASPEYAVGLLNIDHYDPADFMQAPDESTLLWRVFIGSRLHCAITVMRKKIEGSATAEQQLIVQIAARRGTVGVPVVSSKLIIETNPLCLKSGWDFDDADDEEYDEWHQYMCSHLHTWFTEQYAALTAPL